MEKSKMKMKDEWLEGLEQLIIGKGKRGQTVANMLIEDNKQFFKFKEVTPIKNQIFSIVRMKK